MTHEDKDQLLLLRAFMVDSKSKSVNVRYYSTASWAGSKLAGVTPNTLYLDGLRSLSYSHLPAPFGQFVKKSCYASRYNPNCYLIGSVNDVVDIVDVIIRLDTITKLRALLVEE